MTGTSHDGANYPYIPPEAVARLIQQGFHHVDSGR
jgi:hypothetical protein